MRTKLRLETFVMPLFLGITGMLWIGCEDLMDEAEPAFPGANSGEWEVASQALTCNNTQFDQLADVLGKNPSTNPNDHDCTDGRWPNGQIAYKFATATDTKPSSNLSIPTTLQKDTIRKAMNDWQAMTSGVISFVEKASSTCSTSAPMVTMWWTSGQARSSGFRGCSRTCSPSDCMISVNQDSVYHELGHTIGPSQHHHQRYDRNHYLHFFWNHGVTPPDGFVEGRCPVSASNPQNQIDYGPFDYRSTMLYDFCFPAATRPVNYGIADTVGIVDNTCQVAKRRTMISNGFYTPSCPSCTSTNGALPCCKQDQPSGFPTIVDGANIIENYRNLEQPAWKKFLRTVDEDTLSPSIPFDYTIASGVTIPKKASPAVETWGNDSLAIYVVGSDNNIWKKYKANTTQGSETWSGWEKLGKPSSSGTVSDPAVVSWGAGRIDVAVTQNRKVYIKTYNNGWSGWVVLPSGAMASAASAPAITSGGSNSLFIGVRGSDNKLYTAKCSANCTGGSIGFSNFTEVMGGTFRGKPALVQTASSPLTYCAFVHGDGDARLWTNCYASNAWNGWSKVPSNGTLKWDSSCPDCSSPAVAAFGNTLHVYIRGGDNRLWMTKKSSSSGWDSGYTPLGGMINSSPGTVTRLRDSNRSDLVGMMGEEREVDNWQYGAWWKSYRQ